MCFCARKQLRRVRVDLNHKKIMHYDLRSRRVCSLPGIVVQFLSQSPHLHAQGELHPFGQISFASPPLPPSILAFSNSYPLC
jgi:hypothetical protein